MAATPKTYAKLGLFTIVACVAFVVAAFGLGVRSIDQETSTYHTYFDEAVQGLEIGAPVKYRGVGVGKVAAIEIAADRRHVDVSLALRTAEIRRLGLDEQGPGGASPALRTQLGSQGITGVKFVSIDFFDPKTNPVRPLPFAADARTIPAAASLMKGLEDSLVKALDRLPELIDAAVASLGRIDKVLEDFHGQHIPEVLASSLGNLNGAVSDLRQVLRHVDQARIPEKAAKAIDHMDEAIGKVTLVLGRFDGDAGLVASAQRATDSVGDLGRGLTSSTAELDRVLRDLGDAARSVRELADAIERDPDILVKGRAPAKSP